MTELVAPAEVLESADMERIRATNSETLGALLFGVAMLRGRVSHDLKLRMEAAIYRWGNEVPTDSMQAMRAYNRLKRETGVDVS